MPIHTQAFYADVKSRMARYGRTPDQLCILPGLAPIIGRTTAEAKEREQELNDYIVPQYGLHQLSQNLNVDLFSYPLDGPLPELPPIESINGGKSRYQVFVDMARRGNLPAGTNGVIITGVDPASDAAEKGIRPGFVILSVNQQPVRSPNDVAAAVDSARRAGRTTVLLLVKSGNNPEAFVGVDIGR